MDPLAFLDNRQFIFLGGKGGVGKTTAAASLSILAAARGIETLVVSTDPAHSLADAFGHILGTREPTPVVGIDHLFGQEIDSDEAVEEFGTLIQQEDLGILNQLFSSDESFAQLSPPGTDEAVAFMRLLEFIDHPTHDLVIFDTAPTGHTLRLLELPSIMDTWAYKMINFQRKFTGLFSTVKGLIAGKKTTTDPGEVMELLRERVVVGKEKLTDPTLTEFIPVTIPTMLSLWETDRLNRALIDNNIHVERMLINQITPPTTSCQLCQKRNSEQMKIIEKIKKLYSDYQIYEAYLEEIEPQGIAELTKFGQKVFK